MSEYPGTEPSKNDGEGPVPGQGPDSAAPEESSPTDTEETGPLFNPLSPQGVQPSPTGGHEPTTPLPAPPVYGQPPPPYGQPGYPPPGYGQPNYGQPAYGQHPGYGQPLHPTYAQTKEPSATTALVLGLVGLIGAFLLVGLPLVLSPFAWGIGASSLKKIRLSQGRLGGESEARTGMILGIIGTVLLVLGVLLLMLLIVGLVISSNNGSFSTGTSA